MHGVAGADGEGRGGELVSKPAGRRYAVRVREVRMVLVRVWVWVYMGHLRERRRRREPLVRLSAGRPHCVSPPPLDRLSNRKRVVVRRPIRVRRRRNRHVVLVLLPLAAQIRCPRPRTRTRIRTRARTGGSSIHAAVPAALGWRVHPRRGRTRLGAFGRRCRALGGRIGNVKVILMVLSIARPVFVFLIPVRPVVYLIRLIGWVLKGT